MIPGTMWCPYCGHNLRDDMPNNPKKGPARNAFTCSCCGARCVMRWMAPGRPWWPWRRKSPRGAAPPSG